MRKIASALKQLDEADKLRALNLERLRTNLENDAAEFTKTTKVASLRFSAKCLNCRSSRS